MVGGRRFRDGSAEMTHTPINEPERRRKDDDPRRRDATPAAPALGPAAVLALQRGAGNQAVTRMVARMQGNAPPQPAQSWYSPIVNYLWPPPANVAPQQPQPQPQAQPQPRQDDRGARDAELRQTLPAKVTAIAQTLQASWVDRDAEAKLREMKTYDVQHRARTEQSFQRHAKALQEMQQTTEDRVPGKTHDKSALVAAIKTHEHAVESFERLGPALAGLVPPDARFEAKRARFDERLLNVQRDLGLLQEDIPLHSGLTWRGLAHTVNELEQHIAQLRAQYDQYGAEVRRIYDKIFEGFVEHVSAIEANKAHVKLHGAQEEQEEPHKEKTRGRAAPPRHEQRLVAYDEGRRGRVENAQFSAPGRSDGGEDIDYTIYGAGVPVVAPDETFKRHHILGRRYLQLLYQIVNAIDDDRLNALTARIAFGGELTPAGVFWSPVNLFLGPGSRLDDPGSELELKRPASFPAERWNALMALYRFLDGLILDKRAFATEGEKSPLADVDKLRREQLVELVGALARIGAGAAHRMQAADWGVIAPNTPKSQYMASGPYGEKVDADDWREYAGTVADNAPNWVAMCAGAATFNSYRFYVL
jgi:hypothetical protein